MNTTLHGAERTHATLRPIITSQSDRGKKCGQRQKTTATHTGRPGRREGHLREKIMQQLWRSRELWSSVAKWTRVCGRASRSLIRGKLRIVSVRVVRIYRGKEVRVAGGGRRRRARRGRAGRAEEATNGDRNEL